MTNTTYTLRWCNTYCWLFMSIKLFSRKLINSGINEFLRLLYWHRRTLCLRPEYITYFIHTSGMQSGAEPSSTDWCCIRGRCRGKLDFFRSPTRKSALERPFELGVQVARSTSPTSFNLTSLWWPSWRHRVRMAKHNLQSYSSAFCLYFITCDLATLLQWFCASFIRFRFLCVDT